MTAEAFNRWVAAMIAAKLARTPADCMRALKISPNTMTKYKRRGGGGHILALACRALLHRLEPYE